MLEQLVLIAPVLGRLNNYVSESSTGAGISQPFKAPGIEYYLLFCRKGQNSPASALHSCVASGIILTSWRTRMVFISKPRDRIEYFYAIPFIKINITTKKESLALQLFMS